MQVNKNKLGIVLGSFAGLMHLVWAILAGIGLAQPLIDFAIRLHFIDLRHTITPFDFTTAILLVATALIKGYVIGFIIGIIWNKVHVSNTQI